MLCFVSVTFGEEANPSDVKAEQPVVPALPDFSKLPVVPDSLDAFPPDRGFLTQMQRQLTFELQQTQRTIGMLGPNDQQLRSTLESQQATLTKQLKDIGTQLSRLASGQVAAQGLFLPEPAGAEARSLTPTGAEARSLTPMPPLPDTRNFGIITPVQQPVNPWQPQPSNRSKHRYSYSTEQFC
jgi:hypothetical protein